MSLIDRKISFFSKILASSLLSYHLLSTLNIKEVKHSAAIICYFAEKFNLLFNCIEQNSKFKRRKPTPLMHGRISFLEPNLKLAGSVKNSPNRDKSVFKSKTLFLYIF